MSRCAIVVAFCLFAALAVHGSSFTEKYREALMVGRSNKTAATLQARGEEGEGEGATGSYFITISTQDFTDLVGVRIYKDWSASIYSTYFDICATDGVVTRVANRVFNIAYGGSLFLITLPDLEGGVGVFYADFDSPPPSGPAYLSQADYRVNVGDLCA